MLVVLSGCAFDVQYRVKTSQPWPDEWASGPRVPYDRIVQLTGPTVDWHRKAKWDVIAADITRLLIPRPDLYGFTRTGVAQRQGDGSSSEALPYLEVKIGPCFFDLSKPPPKVTVHYQETPFSQAMSDLMGRVGRSYLISPDVADRRPITAHLTDLDWRETVVRVMLEANVFVEPVWYNPVSLRSYEYGSQSEFITAVRQAIDNMRSPEPEAPLTIVPWEQWVRHNQAYQLRYDADLRSRMVGQQFGPPPGTAILSSDLAIAKKQILYALPFQLKLLPSTTGPASAGNRP
jgi:hypothetical protein